LMVTLLMSRILCPRPSHSRPFCRAHWGRRRSHSLIAERARGKRKRASPCIIARHMRIAIGADHAGFALKQYLIATLRRLGHDVDDRGTHTEDPVDYPTICADVAREVPSGRADRGIVIGGSGQGEQMAANKVPGARAALCNDLYTARLSRAHNDANVLAIGGRVVGTGLADEILTLWLTTPFEGGRHQRRLDQIAALEKAPEVKTGSGNSR
jgi:ribose 5-phosphate isomerase B